MVNKFGFVFFLDWSTFTQCLNIYFLEKLDDLPEDEIVLEVF